MALILSIETSTEYCSVVIGNQGQQIAVAESETPMSHATELTLLINACCQQSDYTLDQLDGISVSIGPGSFTALRIGLSTAKGIAYALDKPLVAISSLLIQANRSRLFRQSETETETNILYIPMIDARRMEVYTAYFNNKLEVVSPPKALILENNSFDPLRKKYDKVILCGNGAIKAGTLYTDPFFEYGPKNIHANAMIQLAEKAWKTKQFADLAYVEPYYLKPPNITKPKKIL